MSRKNNQTKIRSKDGSHSLSLERAESSCSSSHPVNFFLLTFRDLKNYTIQLEVFGKEAIYEYKKLYVANKINFLI
jgi:hypothetical protein